MSTLSCVVTLCFLEMALTILFHCVSSSILLIYFDNSSLGLVWLSYPMWIGWDWKKL
jgi:hypothetical protein